MFNVNILYDFVENVRFYNKLPIHKPNYNAYYNT